MILRAAKKIRDGLGITLSKAGRRIGAPTNSKFFKLDLTGTGGAGRSVWWVLLETGDVVPLVLRAKNDKQIGKNMSAENPKFINLLSRNLDIAIQEIRKGKADGIELD